MLFEANVGVLTAFERMIGLLQSFTLLSLLLSAKCTSDDAVAGIGTKFGRTIAAN